MQDERDYLMKRTFPKLKRLAAERDVTLTELDLRWGITEEEAESGKVVEICLREIENSVPFFIGIIGNRYGWVPGKDELGAGVTDRFPCVDGYLKRHLSVTEMEMQFGVLDRKEDVHAYFYIKDQEAPDEPGMLRRLKNAVRKSRYPSSGYSSVEDLAAQVERDFTDMLNRLFPETRLTLLEKTRIAQRAFMRQLCQSYIRVEKNFKYLDRWLADWDKHQLVITGASGLGKSALMAKWVQEKLAQQGRDYDIICHFTGNGGSEATKESVAEALCREIVALLGEEAGGTESADGKKDDLDALFSRVASTGKRLLIVIDAINQISDADQAKTLNWLPLLPKNIKILFSTLEDDPTMDVFRARNYPVLMLQPLGRKPRRRLVSDYLHTFGKRLTDAQIERIVADPQNENTRVLKSLLDELINFGIFEQMDQRIDYYLSRDSIEDFYDAMLQSYEDDYRDIDLDFIPHVLTLLAVSRNGLSESELLAILNAGCDPDTPRVSPLHWSQFYCRFLAHTVTANGLITFSHEYMRRAVHARYIEGNKDGGRKTRQEIINLFKQDDTPRSWEELAHQYFCLNTLQPLRNLLIRIEVFCHFFVMDKYLLAQYWTTLEDKGNYTVEDYLMEVNMMSDKQVRANILQRLLAFTCSVFVRPKTSLLFIREVLNYVTGKDKNAANIYGNVCAALARSSRYVDALEYGLKALDICEEVLGTRYPDTAQSYNNVGYTYGELGDYEKALEYHLKALNIREEVLGTRHPDTATSYNNVGYTYGELGDYEKALEYHLKALNIREQVLGKQHPETATSYNNVGATYVDMGDYPKALEYHLMVLDIREAVLGT